MAYTPVAKQLLCKQRPLLGNARNNKTSVLQPVSRKRIDKHVYNSSYC
jgi:hypothetical protein